MSTAKSTAKDTEASTAKENPEFTAADFADILSTTLAMAAEAGLSVGVRKSEATASRPAGLLVFVAGLTADSDGRIGEAIDE